MILDFLFREEIIWIIILDNKKSFHFFKKMSFALLLYYVWNCLCARSSTDQFHMSHACGQEKKDVPGISI